ncbi:hypothetical protein Fcan01_17986 [Folsomia candida]|uniref:Uncharacterized protein n=1 Tax=Folsomia candida TaxID=158441 RepID=A0A226DRT7_FOLCA|nr:hypothetical protein Fcan01_17986 [Folsomia candida]
MMPANSQYLTPINFKQSSADIMEIGAWRARFWDGYWRLEGGGRDFSPDIDTDPDVWRLIEQNFEVPPVNSSTPGNQLNPLSVAQTLVHVVFPVTCAIQFINSIWMSSSFAQYANSWTTFEEKFQETFKISTILNEPIFPRTARFIRIASNLTFFFVVLMGLAVYPMVKAQEVLATSSINLTWPVHLVSVLTIATILLLDLRSNLMLYINEEAFSQIDVKIQAEIESSAQIISARLIQDWQVLISSARNQTTSCGEILSTGLLMELINLFGTWCSVIYQTIFVAQRDGLEWFSFKYLGPNYFLCGVMYSRLAAKVFLAEKMETAEVKIAKSLQLMEIRHSDLTSLEVDFGGNRKMLLTLINLTYSLVNFTAYVAFPPAIVVMLVIWPCQAPLLGSFLLPDDQCSRHIFQSDFGVMFILRMVLILLEFIQICRNVVVATHYTVYIVVSGILYFWEETTKILRFPSSLEGYRDLQVLEAILNASIRFRLFPTLLTVAPTMEILATFVAIKYHDVIRIIHLILIILLAINAIIVVVMYCTGAGIVCRKSGEYLIDMKASVKDKVERKLLKSFAPLKVRFGEFFLNEKDNVGKFRVLINVIFILISMVNLIAGIQIEEHSRKNMSERRCSSSTSHSKPRMEMQNFIKRKTQQQQFQLPQKKKDGACQNCGIEGPLYE